MGFTRISSVKGPNAAEEAVRLQREFIGKYRVCDAATVALFTINTEAERAGLKKMATELLLAIESGASHVILEMGKGEPVE